MRLTNKERLQLTDALLEVYPQQEDFEMMFEVGFEKKLNTVVDGFGNYKTRIYRLLETSQAEGWMYRLIEAAHEYRPDNPTLQIWLQRSTAEGEMTSPTTLPSEPEIEPPPEPQQPFPDNQPLEQAAECIEEAYDEVKRSKVIFEGGGDIQPIHYLQATIALRHVATCVQNLYALLQTNSPLPAYVNREQLISYLPDVRTYVNESIELIASYRTLNTQSQERNRKDTESRLSTVLALLDELG